MKKAFTLVEILVVIGILGVVMATLMFYIGGNTEAAHAVKCKTNLKNLANAVSSAGITIGDDVCFPLAGSVEVWGSERDNSGKFIKAYSEAPGWISWNSDGAYKSNPTDHMSSKGWFISAYNQDPKVREYCITNGVLYKYVKNHEAYLCPAHIKKMSNKKRPMWSYVMNGYFGYDTTEGEKGFKKAPRKAASNIYAHSTLLFAELQWEDGIGETPSFSASSGFENDCTLQYKAEHGAEIIGFNHKVGNDIVAHVVFADCHVDTIRYPREGMSQNELKELTKLLCTGKDYEIRDGKVSDITE